MGETKPDCVDLNPADDLELSQNKTIILLIRLTGIAVIAYVLAIIAFNLKKRGRGNNTSPSFPYELNLVQMTSNSLITT